MSKAKMWITSAEAAQLLSDNAGRPILADYVRVLARKGKIKTKEVDGRTKLYHRGDCEAYHVAPLRGQRVSERVRDRRKGTAKGRPRKQKGSEEGPVNQSTPAESEAC